MNSATVIRLDVAHAKDAYKLFETINNRGLRLRPTDIIKNFLLGHASTLGDVTLSKVKGDWRGLIVALDQIDSDDYFRQFLQGTLRRKISASKLIAEFKTYYLRTIKEAESLTEYRTFAIAEEEESSSEIEDDVLEENPTETPEDIHARKVKLTDFTTQLRKAAEMYGRIRRRKFESATINRHLLNLERIKSFPSYTLLLNVSLRNLEESTQVSILKVIEAFMMRRHICEKRTGELDSIFASLAESPDEGIVANIQEKLNEHTPNDEEFEEAFARFSFVSKVIDRARYALEMFEYHEIGHKDEFFLAEPSQLHLEHIIPQTIETKKAKLELGDWPTYLGDGWKKKHAVFVHKIGNMTLLADELNISASNNPFLAKKKKYKQSNIQITKNIATSYGAFRFNTVAQRSQALARIAVQLWTV